MLVLFLSLHFFQIVGNLELLIINTEYQFSKQFKKAFGVSPTEYRKRITPDLASE